MSAVRGISNRSNTCYQSCIVQMLMQLSPHIVDDLGLPALKRVFLAYQNGGALLDLIEDMVRDSPFADVSSQEDAHEFLLHLLNLMKRVDPFVIRGYTRMEDLVTGQVRKVPFEDTVLSMRPSATIQASLQTYIERAHISETKAMSVHIKRWPPVLLVHFKRYGGEDVLTTIPLRWRIVDQRGGMTKMRCYGLRAAVVHLSSSHDSGHYISLVLNERGVFVCDDESVRPAGSREAQALLSKAYLLLFVREKKGRIRSDHV